MIAEGTPGERILFTRQGDSGFWGCIAFPTTAGTSSSIKYCKVEYGKYITSLESKYYYGALSFRNSKVLLSNSEITANDSYGVFSNQTTFNIQNCVIAKNKEFGVYILSAFTSSYTIVIANNTITGNGVSGIYSGARCKIVNNIF
ncbi:MAG: right-handed parallel beta-helix repeat-containing protein [Bacteroidales bacterium]|nr:right-handed parallel beta-helix repeat-containing protein [Bacteroidales bacterium]